MRESLNEPVSVVHYYDAKTRHVQPYQMTWQNRDYRLGKIDFWHKTKSGNKLIHHFSIADVDEQMYFKLALDADTLHWTLEEYMSLVENEVVYANN